MIPPPAYPVFLKLKGVPCLVVGGGTVGERRVRGLLKAGARVTVVSPTLTPYLLKKMKTSVYLKILKRKARSSDLRGKRLVFLCTDDIHVQEHLSREAGKKKIWVYRSDGGGDFSIPAVWRNSKGTVAWLTGDPKLSKELKKWWGHHQRKISWGKKEIGCSYWKKQLLFCIVSHGFQVCCFFIGEALFSNRA